MPGRVRICSVTMVIALIQLCQLTTQDGATVVTGDRPWDHPAPDDGSRADTCVLPA
jgi:hypothetical protein